MSAAKVAEVVLGWEPDQIETWLVACDDMEDDWNDVAEYLDDDDVRDLVQVNRDAAVLVRKELA